MVFTAILAAGAPALIKLFSMLAQARGGDTYNESNKKY